MLIDFSILATCLLSRNTFWLCSYDGFDTYMPEGVYCNTLVPGCSSTVSVGSDGRADVKLTPRSSFAISEARKSAAAATA